VRSCNAYFAQLAVRVGPEALASTAELAGVPLGPTSAAARSAEQLPHAGYGQGQVVATPLRMARIAAAIGSDGVIRQAPMVAGVGDPLATTLLGSAAARLLAGDMRDAVMQGTGRRLRDHPARIAGKTGTAEVSGAASHGWFVGFAPHGAATRRVAFAVVLEHAGYGGVGAASVAGELVTAAASRGFVR
jgi:cell division protein FtsI/penicillin-binding protein 2